MELLLLSRIADGTQQIKSIMEERMKRNEIFFFGLEALWSRQEIDVAGC